MRFSGLFLALALAACSSSTADDGSGKPAAAPSDVETATQVIFHTATGDIAVTVEIADAPQERSKGLMNRQSLEHDHGMIFIFPGDDTQSFWMKNTLIPLDMIFVNGGLDVVGVVANAEPLTTSPRGVGIPSTYVVEVNGGFAAANGIAAGTRMSLRGISSTLPKI